MDVLKGTRIATAAAMMLVGMAAGCGNDSTETTTGGIKCEGGNLCAAMGECQAVDGKNACTGMNSCAGMGFVTAKDQADCDAKKKAAAAQAATL